MSPWSVSYSVLDWADIRQFVSGVLWHIGGGRLLVPVVGLLVMLCLQLGPVGGCLMGVDLTPH